MLKTLIKYDFKSTWREFAAIYMSILLGVILFPIIINNISNNIINMFMGLIAFAIIIAVFVITIGSLFKIFNKNVFSNEGYLTMTLPVTTTEIVGSKLLVSSFWIILTGMVSMIGILIFSMIMSPEGTMQTMKAVLEILSRQDAKTGFVIGLIVLFLIISTIKEVSKLFLACSVAHLKQLNRFRVPVGILSYFLLSWMEVLIVKQTSWLLGAFSQQMKEMLVLLYSTSDTMDCATFIDAVSTAGGIAIGYQLIFTALFGVGIVWILNRKLDLD